MGTGTAAIDRRDFISLTSMLREKSIPMILVKPADTSEQYHEFSISHIKGVISGEHISDLQVSHGQTASLPLQKDLEGYKVQAEANLDFVRKRLEAGSILSNSFYNWHY